MSLSIQIMGGQGQPYFSIQEDGEQLARIYSGKDSTALVVGDTWHKIRRGARFNSGELVESDGVEIDVG